MKDDVRKPTQEQIDVQEKYNKMEVEEMLGVYNKYCVFLKLGREPSDNEVAMRYVINGSATNFHKKYGHLLCLIFEGNN